MCFRFLASFLLLLVAAACGKKGPPLAPLNPLPNPPAAIEARVLADTVFIRMTVPTANAPAVGTARPPLSLKSLQIYAVTVAPGAVIPIDKQFFVPANLVATIEVRPPPDPDAPEPDTAVPETRPRPGDVISFSEQVTPALMTPKVLPLSPAAKKKNAAKGTARPSGAAPPAAAPAAAPPGLPPVPGAPAAPPPTAPLTQLSRVYAIRSESMKQHPGAPSTRIIVPLVPAPPAPPPPSLAYSETAITATWTPAPSTTDEASNLQYNLYLVPTAPTTAPTPTANPNAPVPLNPKPLDALTFEHPGATTGTEQCFQLRSVETVGTLMVESAPSPPACVTPKDTFPPAAPKGLSIVADSGGMNLIWDANTEADLDGYLVLRGEAPGDTLQPITPELLHANRYRDAGVTAGVRYVYALIAVDKAGNRSPMSNKVEETAR